MELKKEVKMGVLEGYKELSENYDELYNIATICEEKEFYKLLGNVKGKRILDVGCGTGRYAIDLAKGGAIVEGIDLSNEMLEIARKKAKKEGIELKLTCQDISKISYPKNQFDIVISNLVISHVNDFKKAIKEMVRVCKLKGIIIISTIHPDLISQKREKWAPFHLEDKTLLIRRHKRGVSDYVNSLNQNGAKVKEVSHIKLLDSIKKERPDILDDIGDVNVILLIKAVKITSS
jgi:ubiquinone/menaquinone biosynthesis C-methylase UbiE